MIDQRLWNSIGAMLALVYGLLALLILVDRWRYSRRKTAVLLWCAVPPLLLGILLAHLLLDSWWAAYLSLAINMAAMLLFLLVAPARQGRLLFILLSVFCMLFITGTTVGVLLPQAGGLGIVVRLVLWSLFLLVLRVLFRPSLSALLKTNIAFWYRACLLPLLVTVVYCYFLYSFHIVLCTPPTRVYFSDKLWFVQGALMVLLAALPLCIYIAFYQFFLVINRHYLHLRDSAILSAQLKAMTQESENDRMLAVRDEAFHTSMADFLDRLERHTRAGNVAQARLLLSQIEGHLHEASDYALRAYTGHSVVDAVLSSYAERATREGVSFVISLHPPQDHTLDMTGLAVVLSNGLENAFRASLAAAQLYPPAIRLTGDGTERQYCLDLRNTFAGRVSFDPLTGCPQTNETGHGYGTRSIASFAQAHDGSIRFFVEDHWFVLRMLL